VSGFGWGRLRGAQVREHASPSPTPHLTTCSCWHTARASFHSLATHNPTDFHMARVPQVQVLKSHVLALLLDCVRSEVNQGSGAACVCRVKRGGRERRSSQPACPRGVGRSTLSHAIRCPLPAGDGGTFRN
jgi:hypothetical protein